jgi:very-short-patch-repair endonuclease
VEGAAIQGRESRQRNEAEARELVRQLACCLDDPAYAGKSFGVVVLQSFTGHLQMLQHLINEFITPEQQQQRRIRVGTAPNFQGDERDVIFLSMVVAQRPHKATSTLYRQMYNVAVSRARDQLWLFTSVGLDQLAPDDLRASLMGYMLDPPSVFGPSPELHEVSATSPTKPFGSLFEQQVFRKIRERGFHVVPQYPVGRRNLDLVVVGRGGRIAVECDGHYWHAHLEAQVNDARRDHELARMRWQTVRVRESEFAFDPDRELASLWRTLDDKGIRPGDVSRAGASGWTPVNLPDEEPTVTEDEQ